MINSLYDKFKSWCQNGSIWIISDTHFNDSDCHFMDPYWPEPQEHIDIINKYVQPSDTLIHLGDVGDFNLMNKIRARNKILITGNHDRPYLGQFVFNEIYNGPLFIADRIILSHEPIFGLENFALNIHGHDHGSGNSVGHLNLASNIIGYIPVSLGTLIKGGFLSNIPNYHRLTIDWATEHGIKKEKAET